MMTRLFVSQSEYDAIKKGENTLIVVEAKGKSPMKRESKKTWTLSF